MHLMRTFCYTKCYKCILAVQKCIWCKNAFDAKMLCFLLCKKQRCCAKMHLMRTFCYTKCYKCIFAYILRSKMFSITFYEVKCSASHFPKKNVQHQQNVKAASLFFAKQKTQHFCTNKMWCKNIFLHHILFCWTFSFGKCTPKCIFASNRFLHQIDLMQKSIWCKNLFDAAVFFAQQKTKAVQKCIFAKQSITFCYTKCTQRKKKNFYRK